MGTRSELQTAVTSAEVKITQPKVKKPWVKPVLVRESFDKTAATFGPAVSDGSFTS